MKYFAKIENNIVVNTVVSESTDILAEGTWIEYNQSGDRQYVAQTPHNTFRK